MMDHTICSICILLLVGLSTAQIPIPDRPLGFPYGPEANSLVELDAFLDLACPDSRDAWPTLRQVADHYGVSNLRLNILMFPLPFHRCAWLASQVFNKDAFSMFNKPHVALTSHL